MGIIGYRTAQYKAVEPAEQIKCPHHLRASVGVCSKAGCTKPILMCDLCLTSKDQSVHKCPMIPLQQLQTCAKHLQSLPPHTKHLAQLLTQYYTNLQTTYVNLIRQKRKAVLDRLEEFTLNVKLTDSQTKIYKALTTMNLKNLEVEHEDINFVMELTKKERREMKEDDRESIMEQMKESEGRGVEGNDVEGLEASDILERILGIKSDPPKPEVICTVDNFASLVVTQKQELEKLKSLLQLRLSKFTQMKLIYRASQYYFSAQTFHQLTDLHNNTLLLVRSKKGHIFGGYTPCYWKSTLQNLYQTDTTQQSFLFNLEKSKTYPIKHQMRDTAIQNCADAGPIFGKGHDLILCNGCNHSTFSHSNLGKSYECELVYGGEEAVCELAGEKHFLVEEYEVWQMM